MVWTTNCNLKALVVKTHVPFLQEIWLFFIWAAGKHFLFLEPSKHKCSYWKYAVVIENKYNSHRGNILWMTLTCELIRGERFTNLTVHLMHRSVCRKSQDTARVETPPKKKNYHRSIPEATNTSLPSSSSHCFIPPLRVGATEKLALNYQFWW